MASKTKKTETTTTSKEKIPPKTGNILVLVESPNKVSTIKKILKDGGYTNANVMASVGHFVELKDGGGYKNTGISPADNFKATYAVDPSKQDVYKKMKEAVSKADYIYICSDEDREGEAIGGHMKDFLKIPANKYGRATFHEITPRAVLEALNNPRKLDNNLIDAAHARQIIDKMVGYSLSPIARAELHCRSAGRCQSAGLKLIVDREDEIKAFVPEKYFDLYLHFVKNKTEFRAKYYGTTKKEIKKIPDLKTCKEIKRSCSGKSYYIGSVDQKEQKEFPKPPFTTSTFQQEANKTYGMSVDSAMNCAQKLFEGVNISGEHVALITYIRTDDCSMSPEFAKTLGEYVQARYGKKYYSPVKTDAKNAQNSQEAHECLRVVNVNMTPTDLNKYISDKNLLKIYKLIWERTVMSSMAPAIISDTQYTIRNGENVFIMHSREVIFDGYRRIHVDEEDEIAKEDYVKETFVVDEVLKETKLEEEEKQTQPPKRYTEASFIKELDKRGIGRPSTFATITKTVLAENRGYCKIESKNIVPTEKGTKLSHFLDKSFPELINLHYTVDLEKDLDQIASGSIKQLAFLKKFYKQLQESIVRVEGEEKICPKCGAPLVKRSSRYGQFYGCSAWKPDKTGCNYLLKV